MPARRSGLVAICAAITLAGAERGAVVRRITWDDAALLHRQLEARGVTGPGFTAYVQRVRQANARRVREGDLDHLVFYLLQSTRFTDLPPIEPALSAKEVVESGRSGVPAPVRARVAALLRGLDSIDRNPRLTYFRTLVQTMFPNRRGREAALLDEYRRVMKFVYEKEFVAQRSPRGPEAVAELYRTRGLSTDTAVEAGFLVYQGLGVVRSLDPERRIRRVLIVGPGLDLAPRTALQEAGAPESYQPWAVIDALVGLRLSRMEDLEVVAADINPRVVDHLRRAAASPPTLTLVSEVSESDTVTLSREFRDYFAQLGGAVGRVEPPAAPAGGARLHKTVRVHPAAARTLRAETLDIVTERLTMPAFDLIVATNVLPYFDDGELMLALTNIAGMLSPGGVFLHNEARPLMHDVTTALAMPFKQSRHAIVASVRGTAPLTDSVWIHRSKKGSIGFK